MRRFLAVGLLCLMGLVVGNPAEAGDAAQKSRGSWFSRLFPWTGPSASAGKAAKEAPAPESLQPKVVESAAVQRARELAAWRRRVEVCDKLREIALINKDDNLVRKVDQLDQRAWDTYLQRTAQLGNYQKDQAKAELPLDQKCKVPQPARGLAAVNPAERAHSPGRGTEP